jgi:hypothetical protein
LVKQMANLKPWEQNLARERKNLMKETSIPIESDEPNQSGNPVSDGGNASAQTGTEAPKPGSLNASNENSNAGSAHESSPKIRSDQVKNAVQFLLHPKVQSSSMEERRKFLIKKGLTSAEVDEAFKVAQPDLDRLVSSQQSVAVIPTQPSGPPPPPVMPVQASPTPPPPPPPSQPTSLWQMFIAAAALVGLGTGIGLLVKKFALPSSSGGDGSAPTPAMEVLLGKLDAMQSSIDSNSRFSP